MTLLTKNALNEEVCIEASSDLCDTVEEFNKKLAEWHERYPKLHHNLGWNYATKTGHPGVKVQTLSVTEIGAVIYRPGYDNEKIKETFKQLSNAEVPITPA